MPEKHPETTVAQLNLEKYKTRLGFWQAVWGTLISGGIAVAIPAAVDAYKARLELQKSMEDQKLKDKEIQLRILDSHQQYIANFLNTALNQDIELRIRFAEYFSFVSDPSYRPVWETFRSSLVSRRNDIRDQINSKEMQLDQLRARRASLTLQQQIDFAKLERELSWINGEVGYVRRDSNVTAAAVPTAGSTDKDSVTGESEKLFQDMIINPKHLTFLNQKVDLIVALKEHYDAVQSATGVPWYVVAIVHHADASGRLDRHLNGDPLTARTVTNPSGRPLTGQPPFTWRDSAIDILKMNYGTTSDFSTVGAILYALERYNGFGYRRRNVPSPFIWACTNHYVSGKFVSDFVFDPNHVSAQCGAAPILKVMLDRNIVKIEAKRT
jgi:lysozyme family protein